MKFKSNIDLNSGKILNSDNVFEFREYSLDEIMDMFNMTEQEIQEITSIISDNISKSKVWSSYKTDEEIKKAIIESNEYADKRLGSISSITLKYVESLPTENINESIIYILKNTDTTKNDTLNIYNSSDGWTIIGDFKISLNDYVEKTIYESDMKLKANKTEVVKQDDIMQNLITTNENTVLSTKGLKSELELKENNNNKVISINTDSTDEQYPSAKSVYDLTKNAIAKTNQIALDIDTSWVALESLESSENSNIYYRLQLNNYGDVELWKSLDKKKSWKKECSLVNSNIPDVLVTPLTAYNNCFTGDCEYYVKNGICYINFWDLRFTSGEGYEEVTDVILLKDLPRSAVSKSTIAINKFGRMPVGLIFVNKNETNLYMNVPFDTEPFFASISYPIAQY